MERSIKDTMRSEKEMFDLLISTAREDERILAAYLEGSRTVPGVPKDIFQDYDLVYVVKETRSFIEDRKWIDRFGERLYMQYPDDGFWASGNQDHCYGWLMQFVDGNRLDLHVCTLPYVKEQIKKEEPYQILLDKVECLPVPDEVSDRAYWVKKPSMEEFRAVCNEFWWCLNNVAKGLWRDEIPYVMEMLDFVIRPMLFQVISWKAGIEYDFSISVGKGGKYLRKYLPGAVYESYLRTYPAGEIVAIWKSVFEMCTLFDTVAREVGKNLGFPYQEEEAENSRTYLDHVSRLPVDAKVIY